MICFFEKACERIIPLISSQTKNYILICHSLDSVAFDGFALKQTITANRLRNAPPSRMAVSNYKSVWNPFFKALTRLPADSLAACSWRDQKPLIGRSFYRVAYQMIDGSRLYSNIAEINRFQQAEISKAAKPLRFYPNPTNGPCRLEFESQYSGPGWLGLYTLDG